MYKQVFDDSILSEETDILENMIQGKMNQWKIFF